MFEKQNIESPFQSKAQPLSLKLFEKVGFCDGLMFKLATDKQTGIIGDEKDIRRRKHL